jgi:hypothetical protein
LRGVLHLFIRILSSFFTDFYLFKVFVSRRYRRKTQKENRSFILISKKEGRLGGFFLNLSCFERRLVKIISPLGPQRFFGALSDNDGFVNTTFVYKSV